ncbi:MAG: histidine phosphotransferase ChpT [Methylocystis sp.]
MTQFSLDALDLAALLSSRVCHDVISPVGAIVNGLEVLEDKDMDAEMRSHALALIKSSAGEASARLQFCRLAFGAAGSKGASIDTGDAELVTRQFLADERTQLNWSVPRALMSKNKVKLLLNLCLMADATIPRGGVISVSSSGHDEHVSFKIEAKGTNARLAANIPGLLAGEAEDGVIDARAVQPYYAGLVARACGLDVSVSSEPELVTFEAKPAAIGAAADGSAQGSQSAVA